MTEHSIKIKRLIREQVDMGTFRLVELELIAMEESVNTLGKQPTQVDSMPSDTDWKIELNINKLVDDFTNGIIHPAVFKTNIFKIVKQITHTHPLKPISTITDEEIKTNLQLIYKKCIAEKELHPDFLEGFSNLKKEIFIYIKSTIHSSLPVSVSGLTKEELNNLYDAHKQDMVAKDKQIEELKAKLDEAIKLIELLQTNSLTDADFREIDNFVQDFKDLNKQP